MNSNRKDLKEILKGISINTEYTILATLKKMDELEKKLLIISDKGVFKSVVSIGDLQRAIIKGKPLETPVVEILRNDITVCFEDESIEKVKTEMIFYRSEFMPILKRTGEIVNVIFWNDIFNESHTSNFKELNIPVVIMAGGEGVRLKPLTNIIPKPLVPLGDKAIVELIIDSFVKRGVRKFYLLMNYKASMIENYFDELNNTDYETVFVRESKPQGTAGSLHLLKDVIKETFFVSNCDIFLDQDYMEVLNYHRDNKNELTIIGALKHQQIPYGTLEVEEDGLLKRLKEKPEITLMINSGMYILEPHLLQEIPDKNIFHITDLISNIKKRKGRVGVFPVSEMSWMDIGDWKEYNRAEELFRRKKNSKSGKLY